MIRASVAALCVGLVAGAASAQTPTSDGKAMPNVTQVGKHTGMMTVPMERPRDFLPDGLWLMFEPFQMVEDLLRDDVVYLLRHAEDLETEDGEIAMDRCDTAPGLTDDGRLDMRNLAILLAENGIVPSRVAVGAACRDQQTVIALGEGYRIAEDDFDIQAVVSVAPEIGTPTPSDTAPLTRMIADWDGLDDQDGPLMVVSNFPMIEGATEFRTYEGELLVIDPDRDNRVLGYIRLNTARPDTDKFGEWRTIER